MSKISFVLNSNKINLLDKLLTEINILKGKSKIIRTFVVKNQNIELLNKYSHIYEDENLENLKKEVKDLYIELNDIFRRYDFEFVENLLKDHKSDIKYENILSINVMSFLAINILFEYFNLYQCNQDISKKDFRFIFYNVLNICVGNKPNDIEIVYMKLRILKYEEKFINFIINTFFYELENNINFRVYKRCPFDIMNFIFKQKNIFKFKKFAPFILYNYKLLKSQEYYSGICGNNIFIDYLMTKKYKFRKLDQDMFFDKIILFFRFFQKFKFTKY